MVPRRGQRRDDPATHAYLQICSPGDPAPTYGFSFGNASACSFAFSVNHVKRYAEMFGFRFLDLPSELRNKVYGLTFSDKYGLRPHGLTQINRQIREESLKIFYAGTEVLSIPLRTASQVTCFLKWISDRKHCPNPTATTLDFSYLDPWTGVTTVRLGRELVWPKAVAEEFGAKEQAAGINLPLTYTLLSG